MTLRPNTAPNPKTRSAKALAPVLRPKPRPASAVEAGGLDCSVGYSLRRAQFSTYQQYAAAMLKFEIRPSHYAVLVLIRSNPGLSQSAIAAYLGIQKANFVTLLDGLEKRGLTERRKLGTDRRASALHLTRAGETFVKRLEAAHASLEQRLAARLGDKKTTQLLKLLHEFARAAL